jgi:hypothetical protein
MTKAANTPKELIHRLSGMPGDSESQIETFARDYLGLRPTRAKDGEPALARPDGELVRVTLAKGKFRFRATHKLKREFIAGDGARLEAKEMVEQLINFANGND